MQRKKPWLSKEGFVPALSLVGYVGLFTFVVTNGGRFFPHINEHFAPLMFLSMFCFSALLCSLLVFYQPYLLFVEKRGKEALELVLSTTKWLGIFVLLIAVTVAIFSR